MPWPVVAAVIVVSLVAVGLIGWHALSAPPPAQAQIVATPAVISNNARLTQYAAECRGNFSALSATEQADVMQRTNGNGGIAMRMMYNGKK